MANKHSIVFALSAFLILNLALAIPQDFCSQDNYNTTGSQLQFTKETSSKEYGVIGRFKSLHCCAKGYRSIEWYKDGKIQPWQSSFIIYPESANQTIYTQTLTEDDAGDYTCIIRNDTYSFKHIIQLVALKKDPEDPKITYISESNNVAVGHDIRLFCEAFAGHVDLPDASNDAFWTKKNTNGTITTLDKDPRIQQKRSHRAGEQTYLGTYLIIENVKNSDYGEYICTVTKPGYDVTKSVYIQELEEIIYVNPNPIPVKKLLICLSVLAILGAVVGILYLRYALKLRVQLKDKLGPVEDSSGKTSDVMIVYSEKDTEIALGVLLPTLENQYNYKCASRELPINVNMWYSHLKEPAKSTKRLLPLLSPSLLNGNWESDNVLMALKQLQLVGPQMCCVTLQELPKKENEVKNAQGETLTSLSRNLNVITWNRENDEKFWLSLRLRLPPNRMRLEATTSASNNSRLTMRQESMDNLV